MNSRLLSILSRPLLPLLLICLAVFGAYWLTLSHQFVADDPDFIVNWPVIRQLSAAPQLLLGDLPRAHLGTYRPVRSLLYLLAFQLFTTHPGNYHAFSLLVHLGITLLLYLFITQLFHQRLLATLAALIFALHPIHTEAVSFITASFDTVGYLFLLLSLLFYLSKSSSFFSRFLSLIFALLAFGTNELNLVLPLLLMSIDYLILHRRMTLARLSPYLILVFIYLAFRQLLVSAVTRDPIQIQAFLPRLLISLKAFALYLKLLIFPYPLAIIHTLPHQISTYTLPQLNLAAVLAQRITEPASVISLLVVLLLLGSIYYFRRFLPVASFSLLWIVISLLPILNLFFPSALIFSERYAYLASIGFCLLTGYFLSRLFSSSRYRFLGIILTLTLLTSYFFLTFNRNQDWVSDTTLWQHEVALYPHHPLALLMLGQSYHLSNQFDQATNYYQQSLTIYPDNFKAHYQLGLVYFVTAQHPRAFQEFLTTSKLNPTFVPARLFLDRLCTQEKLCTNLSSP